MMDMMDIRFKTLTLREKIKVGIPLTSLIIIITWVFFEPERASWIALVAGIILFITTGLELNKVQKRLSVFPTQQKRT